MKTQVYQFLFFVATLSILPYKSFSQSEQTFQLGDFRLESNVILPKAYIKYVTYGSLNKDKSNAILLPSWFGADYNGYNSLIGKDNALDTAKYFLILSQLFANGHSSSPSNSPPPFNGPLFPIISIRDNVRATYELVNRKFEIKELKSIIGYSMGAQQAFQWPISYPGFTKSIVAICGTAKTYPHGYVMLESAISTIKTDTAWLGGFYSSPPRRGLRAWTLHWLPWYLSQEWYRKELYKQIGFQTIDALIEQFVKNNENLEANNLISQAATWQRHNIADSPGLDGNIEKALAQISCKVLYMPGQTDLYFPLQDAEYEKLFIKNLEFAPIPSVWGHIAGLGLDKSDRLFMNKQIHDFLVR